MKNRTRVVALVVAGVLLVGAAILLRMRLISSDVASAVFYGVPGVCIVLGRMLNRKVG